MSGVRWGREAAARVAGAPSEPEHACLAPSSVTLGFLGLHGEEGGGPRSALVQRTRQVCASLWTWGDLCAPTPATPEHPYGVLSCPSPSPCPCPCPCPSPRPVGSTKESLASAYSYPAPCHFFCAVLGLRT